MKTRFNHEIDGDNVIDDLIIMDVNLKDTDEQLWDWVLTNVLFKHGIEVKPWMKYSIKRKGTTAYVTLRIPLEKDDEHKPN